MLAKFLLAAGLALQASASTIAVKVGANGLTFTPNTFNASKGDVLEFHFYAKNHSVVQGDFDNPCVPAASGGFFSGFFPTNGTAQNAKVFSVTLNDTQPLVFYCSQNVGSHCVNGMAAVVNPTVASSLSNYLAQAKTATTALSPPSVFGGSVGPAPPSSTTTSPSGGSPTGPSSAPSTSAPNGAGSLKASVAGLVVAAGAVALCMA